MDDFVNIRLFSQRNTMQAQFGTFYAMYLWVYNLVEVINLKKRMVDYLLYAEEISSKDLDTQEKELIRKNLLIQIGFFQHERLIHLIVTVTFAIISMITLICLLLTDNIFLSLLLLLLLLMLIPYVNHYFRLEWGVQKLYKFYDKLEESSWRSKS